MIPVAMIGSAAPVSFIATSATPLFTSVNLATTSAPSPVSSSSGGVKQTFKKMPQDMSSNSQEVCFYNDFLNSQTGCTTSQSISSGLNANLYVGSKYANLDITFPRSVNKYLESFSIEI